MRRQVKSRGEHFVPQYSSNRDGDMNESGPRDEPARFRLPVAVAARLQDLLDRQDAGQTLTPEERGEAAGLVDLADLLTLLRLRAEREAS